MAAVTLHHRHYPGPDKAPGAPWVILHGLLGSSRNWHRAAEALSADAPVWVPDARNHGDSPHTQDHTYHALAGDLEAFLGQHGLGRIRLIGHSMGGKTALRFAVDHPGVLERLVIVDIAPKPYERLFASELAAMEALDLGALPNRQAADHALQQVAPDWAFRQFLLSNLSRDRDSKAFRWSCHLSLLRAAEAHIATNPLQPGEQFAGECLCIRGEHSNFLTEGDLPLLRQHCPQARLATVAGAAHNPHFDNLPGFLECLGVGDLGAG